MPTWPVPALSGTPNGADSIGVLYDSRKLVVGSDSGVASMTTLGADSLSTSSAGDSSAGVGGGEGSGCTCVDS